MSFAATPMTRGDAHDPGMGVETDSSAIVPPNAVPGQCQAFDHLENPPSLIGCSALRCPRNPYE